jgi:hypothetical protein
VALGQGQLYSADLPIPVTYIYINSRFKTLDSKAKTEHDMESD